MSPLRQCPVSPTLPWCFSPYDKGCGPMPLKTPTSRAILATTVTGMSAHPSEGRSSSLLMSTGFVQAGRAELSKETSHGTKLHLTRSSSGKNLKTQRKRFSPEEEMISRKMWSCSPTDTRCHKSPRTPHIPQVAPAWLHSASLTENL